MTAAALKPRLFDHLIATRPDGPDKSSFVATALSVLFHASLVLAMVWASAHLRGAIVAAPNEVVQPIFIATPASAPDLPARGSSSGLAAAPSAVTLSVPTDIPTSIPAVDPSAAMPTDFAAQPAAPGTSTPAPGTTAPGDSDTRDGFRVLSTMPRLLNVQQVERALSATYPPLLRDSGIGGRALVWVLLDEDGRVLKAEIKESTGHAALDDAALRIAPQMRFSPALNRSERVKVWVSVPVMFSSR